MGSTLSNKTKFFIGTAAEATTLTQFQADVYEEIVNVFDLGEFGDMAEAVEDTNLGEGRIRRLKGSADGGTMDLIVNFDRADAGQTSLAAASKLDDDVNFKIVMPTGTTFFFRANVLGGRISFGESDNIVRTTWSIAINSDRLEHEAA